MTSRRPGGFRPTDKGQRRSGGQRYSLHHGHRQRSEPPAGKQRAFVRCRKQALAQKVRAGGRLSAGEALELYLGAPTHVLGRLADDVRRRRHPARTVTYIIDRNVNYTNVCVARCSFCAFYRPVGAEGGYVLGFEEIFRKIEETIELGGGLLLLQGGHNPDLPIEWYEDLFRAVKRRYAGFKLHARSSPEVLHISRLSQLPVPEVIGRLVAAGLDSIPGGGAEILVDRVRRLLHCYSKAPSDEWLDVMRHAAPCAACWRISRT